MLPHTHTHKVVMLTNLIVVIILHYIHISYHHMVSLKLTYVNNNPIKLENKKEIHCVWNTDMQKPCERNYT